MRSAQSDTGSLGRAEYTERQMLERAKTRSFPVLNKTVDLTPAVQACCGVCRTCMTTNVLALMGAAAAGAALYIMRFARRFARRSPHSREL
jgi:hypothetical protein